MKGWIPVDIPTKKYIKAYVLHKHGLQPKMSTDHEIGNKLYDLLHHSVNERKNEFSNKRYNCTMRIYISMHTFRQRGANLNHTNIKNFNLFVERKLKEQFYHYMDTFTDILSSFSAHLPEIRKKLGIDIESWDDDSMRKDYFRYRKQTGKPLFYKRNFTRTVPTDKSSNAPF